MDALFNYDQLSNWHNRDLFTHTIDAVSKGVTVEEKMALLLHDIGKIQDAKYAVGFNFEEIEPLKNAFF